MLTKTLVIANPSGLHMRPAGIFVKACSQFKSEISFDVREKSYNAKSMINVLSAAVKCGDEIELQISGEDEQVCLDTIIAAVESGLGEKV